MTESVAAYPLLTGLLGQPSPDLDALATALSRLSLFAAGNPIESLDINPFLVRTVGARTLDAVLVTHPHTKTAPDAPSRPRPFPRVPSSAYNRPSET